MIRARLGIWLFLSACFLAADAAELKRDETELKRDETFARIDRMSRELNGSCSYAILDKNNQNEELMCVLQTLRKRCNEIDDCYVYCIGNDVGVNVGGSCAHLCNYGLRSKWESPQGIEACEKK